MTLETSDQYQSLLISGINSIAELKELKPYVGIVCVKGKCAYYWDNLPLGEDNEGFFIEPN